MLQCLLIAFSISIDSFSVGVAFGIKGVKVPLRSIFILDLISVTLLSFGFLAGNLLSGLFPPHLTNLLSSLTILFIGMWYFIEGLLNYYYPSEKIRESTSIMSISIQSLGIAINILRNPLDVDLDTSGVIDSKEAILLGFALAIDSLVVGFAVAPSSPLFILITLLIVTIMNLVFLFSGMGIGKKFFPHRLGNKIPFIPGMILIGLGLLKLF